MKIQYPTKNTWKDQAEQILKENPKEKMKEKNLQPEGTLKILKPKLMGGEKESQVILPHSLSFSLSDSCDNLETNLEQKIYYEKIRTKDVPPLSAFVQPCVWVREAGGYLLFFFFLCFYFVIFFFM
jgi:hypothetical protein